MLVPLHGLSGPPSGVYSNRLPHPVLKLRGLGSTAPQVLPQPVVSTIASTIQTQEGYYPGSIAYTNNNPGNLVYAGQAGATPGANGFAVFDSYADGEAALQNQIQLYASRGDTISQMMNIYAPATQAGNNPTAYAQTIANALGVSPDTTLTDLAGSDLSMSSDTSAGSSDVSQADSGSSEADLFGMSGSQLAVGAGILGLLALWAAG